jgi:hypothetical protein
MMLVGGMLCNAGTLPSYVAWLQYLSPIRYGYEALVWNEYEPMNIDEGSPNPIVYLNFTMGKTTCLLMLFILSVCLRIAVLIFLKLLVRRPV